MLLNRSWGGKGAPFCSTLQLSHSFKMLNWFYKWRLWGYIFVWEKVLPQSHRDKPCAQSARRQTSLLSPFTPLCFSFQNECASYTGRSDRASVRSRRLAGRFSSSSSRRLAIRLCPLRGHLILSKTAPSVCLEKMIMLR